jgi:hypothetical protein
MAEMISQQESALGASCDYKELQFKRRLAAIFLNSRNF